MEKMVIYCFFSFLISLSLCSGFVRCEDPVDGEVNEEGGQIPIEDEGYLQASNDAAVSFLFTTPADANINKGAITRFVPPLSHSLSLALFSVSLS